MTRVVLTNPPYISYNGRFIGIEDNKMLNLKLFRTLRVLLGFDKCESFFKFFKIDKKDLTDTSGFRYGVRAGSRWPWSVDFPHKDAPYPFIMGYTAALLKKEGFNVEIIEAVVSEIYSSKKYLKMVKAKKPDIVIVECAAVTMEYDLWVAKNISEFAEVALAGPHLTEEEAEKLKKENPYIKYILMGEYILSAVNVCKTRANGVYPSEVVKDLDSIPFPYRGYKDAEKHFDITMPTEKPQLQIYASKGCPFKCKFCLWPQTMYKGHVAQRAPKMIAEEIKYNVKKYGYKSIFFDDDTFNVGVERISELCDYLKEIGLPWTMMGRLDCSPIWLYDKMVDCGCVGMRFGVETFNLKCLKHINKGLERVDFLSTLKYLTDKYPKVWIHLTMMKDMPGQTEEIHQNDMKILKELGYELGTCNILRSFQLGHCVPFKGTKLYIEMEELLGKEYMEKNNTFDGAQTTLMSKLNEEGFWEDKDVD